MIGPAAIPALSAYLGNLSHGTGARIMSSSCLSAIGKAHPDSRAECVAALMHQLEHFANQEHSVNGFIVAALLDLEAVEAAALMERAFAADAIDESVKGDWEDVQIELGLKEHRETMPWMPRFTRAPSAARSEDRAQRKERAKIKAKRKQAKAMRKKSRKKR